MAVKTKNFEIDGNTLAILAALGLTYFGVLDPILKRLGIKNDGADKAQASALATLEKAPGWSAALFLSNRGKGYSMFANADKVAKKIYDSWGIFNDNEAAIISAIRACENQFMLSQLVDAYARLYRDDLYTRMQQPWYYGKDGLDPKEILIVANIVNSLPMFTKPKK